MTESRRGFDIVRAGVEHLEEVATLFDDYRVFYRQPPDAPGAKKFIGERLQQGDSVIFLALARSVRAPLGLTQLYPSFSSVSMKRLWILNDLYVAAQGRRQGIARALIERARLLAGETGAKGLILETAIDNTPARRLYDSCGFTKDIEFDRYALDV
jgi:ribosomal protein S18 acetylase RimI-like enzyme